MPAPQKLNLDLLDLRSLSELLRKSVVHLVLAAILTSVYLLVSVFSDIPSTDTRELLFEGPSLIAQTGDVRIRDDFLSIRATDRNGQVILSRHVDNLPAEAYSILHYDIVSRNPNLRGYFFWRTREQPESVHTTGIGILGDKEKYQDMSTRKDWVGHIIELGFLFSGEPTSRTSIILKDMSLSEKNIPSMMLVLSSGFREFRNWDFHSINYLSYGSAGSDYTPALLAGTVFVLSSIFLFLSLRYLTPGKTRVIPSLASSGMLLWIMLDLYWQMNLYDKTVASRSKALENRNSPTISSRDGEIYAYVEYLKNSILPRDPVVLYLFNPDSRDAFSTLRARYHFLPHNVFILEKQPVALKPNSWIFALGTQSSLQYDPFRKTLRLGDGPLVTAERRHQSLVGQLYEIRE